MKKLVMVVAALMACSGDKNVALKQPVGASGGTVVAGDGSGVSIPAGSLGGDVTVTITSAPSAPAPASATVVTDAYTFGPEGQQFTVPVTVTIGYSDAKIPAGKTAADLAIFTAPAGSSSYTQLATTADTSKHTISATTTHFSTFVGGLPTVCTVYCSSGGGTCKPGSTCPVSCNCGAFCMSDGSPGTGAGCKTGGGTGSGGGGTCPTPVGINYALACDASGACSCTTDGAVAKTTTISCNASTDPMTTFAAYTSACGFPGAYGSNNTPIGTNPDGGGMTTGGSGSKCVAPSECASGMCVNSTCV